MLSSYYGIYNYTYDANGIRIKKTAGSTTTHYILDGETILAEYNGTAYKKFFYDESGIAGMIYNGATYYFMKNLQGDVVGVYDSAGTLLGEYVYDAWGNLLNSVTNDVLKANPFRYRGYYYDTETKLYYLNSRYYDPATGRFLNMDIVSCLEPETLSGLNLYAYCYNNPVMYTDPSGNFPILAIILGVTALVGMAFTIAGVAKGNNTLTAIGLTMVAVPALISGGMAIAAGIAGATFTGIVGGVTVMAGVGSGLFASAEYQEAFTGNNWMLDTGISEGWYNGLMIVTATIATLGTFASSVGSAFEIKSISKIGKFREYYGMKFQNAAGKTRVLSFHTHGHKVAHGIKSVVEWHWQLQKWNPRTGETAGTIARWIWWRLVRR